MTRIPVYSVATGKQIGHVDVPEDDEFAYPDDLRPANSPSLTGQICITGRLSPAERAQVEFLMRSGPIQLLEPVNSSNLPRQGALPHRLGEEEGRRPLKTRGLLRQLIASLHPASFLRKLMRK